MIRRAPDRAEAQRALDLIVAAQADPATACAYLGVERHGIVAELEALHPGWQETLRIAEAEGRVVAAAAVDWDEEVGGSWIHGPWATDPTSWASYGAPLVAAMIAQAPASVLRHELSAAPANVALAALAERLGWSATEVNYAYVARTAEGWPAPDDRIRPARIGDLAGLAALHDAEFPATYATARQLIETAGRVSVVLADGDVVVGYASAEVKPDGEGYLDFLAVAIDQRGRGLSKALLASIGRTMLASSPNASVNLTVKASNAPAIALYEGFGFVRDAELVGYRSPPVAPSA